MTHWLLTVSTLSRRAYLYINGFLCDTHSVRTTIPVCLKVVLSSSVLLPPYQLIYALYQ